MLQVLTHCLQEIITFWWKIMIVWQDSMPYLKKPWLTDRNPWFTWRIITYWQEPIPYWKEPYLTDRNPCLTWRYHDLLTGTLTWLARNHDLLTGTHTLLEETITYWQEHLPDLQETMTYWKESIPDLQEIMNEILLLCHTSPKVLCVQNVMTYVQEPMKAWWLLCHPSPPLKRATHLWGRHQMIQWRGLFNACWKLTVEKSNQHRRRAPNEWVPAF